MRRQGKHNVRRVGPFDYLRRWKARLGRGQLSSMSPRLPTPTQLYLSVALRGVKKMARGELGAPTSNAPNWRVPRAALGGVARSTRRRGERRPQRETMAVSRIVQRAPRRYAMRRLTVRPRVRSFSNRQTSVFSQTNARPSRPRRSVCSVPIDKAIERHRADGLLGGRKSTRVDIAPVVVSRVVGVVRHDAIGWVGAT